MKLPPLFLAMLLAASPCLAQGTTPPPVPPPAAPEAPPPPGVNLMAALPEKVAIGQPMPAIPQISVKALDGKDLLVMEPDGSYKCLQKPTPADLGAQAQMSGYVMVLAISALCGVNKTAAKAATVEAVKIPASGAPISVPVPKVEKLPPPPSILK